MGETGKLQVRLFGRFAVTASDDKPVKIAGKKNQALLAYLAANAGKAQPRERLAGLLWGDRFDDQARQSLRQTISKLRKDLGDAKENLLLTDGDDIALNSDAISIDALAFEKLAADGSPDALEEAAGLYGGAFLDGFSIKETAFEDWVGSARTRYADLAADVLSRHCLRQKATGQISEAIVTGNKLVRLDPTREQSHRELMRLLAIDGQRSQAIKQYRLCADILEKELGVEPEAATKQLYEDISGSEGSALAAPDDIAQTVGKPQILRQVPDKPSIAVLPFTNMSGDQDQEFFADGMAEDIITALSRFHWLFVIARNSSFTYKGRAVDVKDVARDFGVRYVLEGSVRKIGQRIRVTGQLVDAESGNNIWAERYDRELDDLFAIQDEITDAIVAAIEPEVGAAERERVLRKLPETLDAWGLYQKGLAAYYDSTQESFRMAIEHFDQVNAIDPGFALAYAMGAESRYRYVANWNPKDAESLRAEATEKAQRAIALDPRESMCVVADARVCAWQGQFDLAIAKAHQAVDLNPNNALAYHARGSVLGMAHKPDEALESFDQAIRLNPTGVFLAGFQVVRAATLFQLERYEESVECARQSVHAANPRLMSFAILAASLSELDRIEETKPVLEQLYERQPNFRLSRISGPFSRAAGPNLAEALRKVGVPE